MKKLIAALTLLLAFTINANAQERKMSNDEAAKMDAVKLAEYLDLKGTQQEDFMRLFQMKHATLNDPNVSVERKKEMSRVVEAKLRASLTTDQLQKLDANPEMLARFTGSAVTDKQAAPKK
jgi:hypothetical protein